MATALDQRRRARPDPRPDAGARQRRAPRQAAHTTTAAAALAARNGSHRAMVLRSSPWCQRTVEPPPVGGVEGGSPKDAKSTKVTRASSSRGLWLSGRRPQPFEALRASNLHRSEALRCLGVLGVLGVPKGRMGTTDEHERTRTPSRSGWPRLWIAGDLRSRRRPCAFVCVRGLKMGSRLSAPERLPADRLVRLRGRHPGVFGAGQALSDPRRGRGRSGRSRPCRRRTA